MTSILLQLLALASLSYGEHHMNIKIAITKDASTTIPLIVTNQCKDTIYPGIVTVGGTGPASQGFELTPGANLSQTVSPNWQGRVWGRTNCSFNSQGTSQGGGAACVTGDCGGTVSCTATGAVPVTLAEFTLDGGHNQTFYDISLVDGYNLPMAIVTINPSSLPPNQGNPSCVATVGDLAPQGWSAYANGGFLGTDSSDPLPFDTSVTTQEAWNWCPWDLQEFPPAAPGDGVYPYPDTNIQRPAFDPCLSACAKYNKDSYCCTGSYKSPTKCGTNYYSVAAKKMCPDAYSFAFDDQTSTFITAKGPGFNIIFCPGGRSTAILSNGTSIPDSSAGSSGSFRPSSERSHPILDALVGTSGRAVLAGLVVTAMTMVAF